MAIAKPKETDHIRFELADITHQATESYNMLLVIDVLEHLDNYFEFLRGILPKAHYTIFHISLDMSVWSLFREQMLLELKARVGHIYNFTEDFILSVLSDYGFRLVDKPFYLFVSGNEVAAGSTITAGTTSNLSWMEYNCFTASYKSSIRAQKQTNCANLPNNQWRFCSANLLKECFAQIRLLSLFLRMLTF
ncbi:hypothetical protein [Hymenobacter bucti]|uniref:Methyltransferase domain-containing protein n=1 Tax=Hymenobacter bucti TaxID=1844114 RepID=A0ABW4R1U1_9BACT